MMKKESVIEAAMGAHGATYGVTAGAVAWAPGRIEVLGNHTDYNEGTHIPHISRSISAHRKVLALNYLPLDLIFSSLAVSMLQRFNSSKTFL